MTLAERFYNIKCGDIFSATCNVFERVEIQPSPQSHTEADVVKKLERA